ncbi:MAG: S8 family peptidase [Planctomycetia bacterium]|nr:S8 family peptidase [Planctomycetia bacterium]
MAEEDLRPLLRLGPPSSVARKKGRFVPPPLPQREVGKHGLNLRSGALRALGHFGEAEKRFPKLATDVPVVRVELPPKQYVSDAELMSVGLTPVLRRHDSVIAAFGQDRALTKLTARVRSYESGQKAIAPLAKIEHLAPWSATDRRGPRLMARPKGPEEEVIVDVLFLPAPDGHVSPQGLNSLSAFAKEAGGQILDTAFRTTFVSARVKMKGQALQSFLEYRDDVAEVELPPYTRSLARHSLEFGLDDVQPVVPPPPTAPLVCIVDSGIREGHPLIGPSLMPAKSKSFPASLGPPIPNVSAVPAGHGTLVAGIAAFGEVRRHVDARKFTSSARLINARMLGDQCELDTNRQPFLRDVVDHVAPDCRILNLSLGLAEPASKLTKFGAELDELVRSHGVLPIVSSGNRDFQSGAPPRHAQYPTWMEHDDNRVCAPGESLNALTVGGIAPREAAGVRKAEEERVADPGAPSPFARAGSLRGLIKPEVVEVAGNWVFDTGLKAYRHNIETARVLTTRPDFAAGGRLLVHEVGTSLAAPKIANLAAAILAKHPEASPNLMRALIVNAARHPEEVVAWKIQRQLRLCGFGVPKEERALYCSNRLATLYHEGKIRPNEVQLFEVPVPREFAASKGSKRIWVTVAYDPPTNVFDELNIAGIRIGTHLARGDRSEADVLKAVSEIEAAAEQSDGEPEESVGKKGKRPIFWRGKYPYRMQSSGSVYKNLFEWKRGVYGESYRLALVAKAVRPAHQAELQGFAVVVGLEAEDPDVNVYTSVRARVEAIRSRVRIGRS